MTGNGRSLVSDALSWVSLDCRYLNISSVSAWSSWATERQALTVLLDVLLQLVWGLHLLSPSSPSTILVCDLSLFLSLITTNSGLSEGP